MHAGMRYPKRGTDTGGQTRRRRQYTTASVRARRLWMSAAGPARLPLYGWPAPRGTLPFACKARARGTRRRKRGCARTGTAAGRIVAALGAARGRADPAGAADRILLPNLPRDRGGDRRKRGTRRPRHPCQMQHGPVADAIARGGIRSVEHRLHLLPQKIGDQTPIRLLERDGEDAADMFQGCRLPVFEEVEEDLMAASRTLRVTGAFLRLSSRYSRKALMRPQTRAAHRHRCDTCPADQPVEGLFDCNVA